MTMSDKDLMTLIRRHFHKAGSPVTQVSWNDGIDIDEPSYAIRRFVADVERTAALAMRERCAQACEKVRDKSSGTATECIAAVRALEP